MKKTIYSFLIIISIACLQGCDPEPDCDKVITHNIQDLEQYISYTGNDTLRFLHNNLDTQTYIGQGLERYYVRCCKNADGDCYEDHESVRINYKHSTSNEIIIVDFPFFTTTMANHYVFSYKKFKSVGGFQSVPISILINKNTYNYGFIFINSHDTSQYIIFSTPNPELEYSGIVKIKYPGDTLTLIR